MSDIVLRVENLWKQYRLGVTGATTLRDDLARFWARVRGKEDPTALVGSTNALNEVSSNYVWALQDINFEVKRGEVLGIIGKNGAGKSTLLKILSKVTGPTRGHIQIKGRVASLLEVGTGFHPELTGRENIFLNGAILGMTKAEIRKKLDEIIDFAGVAKYVDTPVKRYSSGMRVRLGFAVAAFLEPEILVVDEVLAVGDAEFQKKAIGKMQDVSQGEGRTVLFVSHNMGSIQSLCNRCVVLKNGNIVFNDITNKAISHYLSLFNTAAEIPLPERIDRVGKKDVIFTKIEFYIGNEKCNTLITGKPATFRLFYKMQAQGVCKYCRIGLACVKQGVNFFLLSTELVVNEPIHISKDGYFDFQLECLPLSVGNYSFTLFLESQGIIQDWISDAAIINVEDGPFFPTGKSYPQGWEGKTLLVKHTFTFEGDG
ncbi:MAG: hypothetical protein OHK0053_23600 [Microscillaceae bacterium]